MVLKYTKYMFQSETLKMLQFQVVLFYQKTVKKDQNSQMRKLSLVLTCFRDFFPYSLVVETYN